MAGESPNPDETLAALAAGEEHDAETLRPALNAAERLVRARTPRSLAEQAVADLRFALIRRGAAALGGGDPQRVEDALYAARPTSPLPESVFRHAWLALVDTLARTGEAPPFGGSGGKESWAFTARSRPARFDDPDAVVERVASRFGAGVAVVSVRGPGRSATLAAVRRALLAEHGTEAVVPPVTSAARDALGGFFAPYLARVPFEGDLAEAIDRLPYGEDHVGLLGRAGAHQPVALIVDDAHLQARALLLGAPIFLEPGAERDALLVVGAPDDPADDGPLTELLADARERSILTEIDLPAFDEDRCRALLATAGLDADLAPALHRAAEVGHRPADRLRVAAAWIDELADVDARAERLAAGYDADARLPAHAAARGALARAAIEGLRFHGFTLGHALDRDEDFVEDLLHDDELEIDGEVVGTCDAAVPADFREWADLPGGLHPVFRFADFRLVAALRDELPEAERAQAAGKLRDALLRGYGPPGAWQVADRLWRLDHLAEHPLQVQQLLMGAADAGRVEAGFRRMLPVLRAEKPYRLALARLYGASMEAGALASRTGKVQVADQAFQAAAAAGERLKRPGPAGEALARLGEVRLALALPEPATLALDVAEKLLNRAEHSRSLARVMLLRAEVEVLRGELPRAMELLQNGIDRLEQLNDPGHAALGMVRLGRLQYEVGQRMESAATLATAIQRADASGDPRPAGAARMAHAFVLAEEGDLEPAFARVQEAANAFQAARMPVHIAEVAAAGLQRRHGAPAEAEKRLRKVAEAFKKAGAAIQWADTWHEVGRCLLDQEKFGEAGTAFLEVVDIRKRARDRFALARLFEELGEARKGQGDAPGALAEYAKARRLAERVGLDARMGRLDAAIATLTPLLDEHADADIDAIRARAAADVDEMEAVWAAPPQAPPNEDGAKTVH